MLKESCVRQMHCGESCLKWCWNGWIQVLKWWWSALKCAELCWKYVELILGIKIEILTSKSSMSELFIFMIHGQCNACLYINNIIREGAEGRTQDLTSRQMVETAVFLVLFSNKIFLCLSSQALVLSLIFGSIFYQ